MHYLLASPVPGENDGSKNSARTVELALELADRTQGTSQGQSEIYPQQEQELERERPAHAAAVGARQHADASDRAKARPQRNVGPRQGPARRDFVTTDQPIAVRAARVAARSTPQALISRDFACAAGPADYTAAHDQPAIFSAPRKRRTRGLSAFLARDRHEPYHCLCL